MHKKFIYGIDMMCIGLNTPPEVKLQKNSINLCYFQVNHKDSYGEGFQDIKAVARNIHVFLLWRTLYRNVEYHKRKFIHRLFDIATLCKSHTGTKNAVKKERV